MEPILNFDKKLNKYRVRKIFKETIEPEEILLDASKPSDLEDQKIEVPIKPRTFQIFFGVVISLFLILVGQSAYLQIIKGPHYQGLAEKNKTRSLPLFASRGIIYDRSMNQLVYNIPSFDLVLTPPDLPRSLPDRQKAIDEVAVIVGLSAQEIKEEIQESELKSVSTIPIIQNLEHEKLLSLQTKIDKLPGFSIEKNITRQYVLGPYFSHIIGYLGKLNSEDIKNNLDYFLTEKIGKNGLEAFYEKILRGKPGQKFLEVDAYGRPKGEVAQIQPQNGKGLVLAVDSGLQKKIYEKLNSVLQGMHLKKAAAVALDPRDGSILAMVSFPSFDNNLFSQGFSSQSYSELLNNSAQPLFNRAISGQYPPGSTIKPLIGAAALQEKVVTPSTKIFDSGELALVNQYDPQIIYRFPDWKAHGAVDIYSAIAQSCDVYFYTIGGGYGKIEGLGIERLGKYFKLFGFGSILGIDLFGENIGLVPDNLWKQKTKNERWYTGDTYHVSIGQGDLLVTPLQLAAATAALLNGGKVILPHLVDKIVDSDKNTIETYEPKVLQQGFIDGNNLAIIKEGMRQTVTVGSALLLNNLPVKAGAKTGTAQVAGQRNPNAWVTVFAPYDNPEMVLVILIENAGEGSEVAVPVAYDVLREYFKK
jgi:penicillin-binding protein 2